jgi:hypothetical protein
MLSLHNVTENPERKPLRTEAIFAPAFSRSRSPRSFLHLPKPALRWRETGLHCRIKSEDGLFSDRARTPDLPRCSPALTHS